MRLFSCHITDKGTGGTREERGRDANIENHENRFADMERREGSGGDELT